MYSENGIFALEMFVNWSKQGYTDGTDSLYMFKLYTLPIKNIGG